jgi:hypothetical protein
MMDLQTAYNAVSGLGFVICMYKIYKLENAIETLQTNALVNSITSFLITKTLKERNILSDEDMNVNLDKEIQKLKDE